MAKISQQLGFHNMATVVVKINVGGLALLWPNEANFTCNWKSDKILCGEVLNGKGKTLWSLVTCYGIPYQSEKKEFWEKLSQFMSVQSLLCLMVGDFNKVISKEEKFGGRSIWKKHMFPKQLLIDYGGFDLGYCGSNFNWSNRQEGLALIKERLDRAIVDRAWLEAFQSVKVCNLRSKESYHCPILVYNTGDNQTGARPFQFIQAWTTDPSSVDIVHMAWNRDRSNGMEFLNINRSIINTTKAL